MPLLLKSFDKAVDAANHVIGVMEQNLDLIDDPAVCFDIDETLILNHPTEDDKFRRNDPVANIYDWAVAHGVKVYVITARPKIRSNAEWTQKILEKSGITNCEKVYYEPEGMESGDAKYAYRKRIWEKHGQCCMLSVGDQWTDLLQMTAENKEFTERVERNVYHVICGDTYSSIGLKLYDYN